jgi:hypothetical protein
VCRSQYDGRSEQFLRLSLTLLNACRLPQPAQCWFDTIATDTVKQALFVLLLIAADGIAQAEPIVWTLSGVTMTDGATAFGSFVYNADTNVFSQINITSVGGSVFAGAHYVAEPPVPGLSLPDRLILVTSPEPINFFGTPALALYPSTGLTNAGGVVNLLGGIRSHSFETTCGALWSAEDCDAPGTVRRYFSGGQLTSSAVPEPTAFCLTALGVLVTICIRRVELT